MNNNSRKKISQIAEDTRVVWGDATEAQKASTHRRDRKVRISRTQKKIGGKKGGRGKSYALKKE